jgi:hypothetical protein
MNCFNGYVGLKGCSNGTPASGLFINQLPGLPSELFTQIANTDQATFVNVWNDIQATSQAQLLSDARKEFGKRYKMRSILRKIDIGKNIDTAVLAPIDTVYLGFQLLTDYGIETGYTRSHLMGIPVEYLELYMPGLIDDPFNIYIIDKDTNEILFQKTYSDPHSELIVGWNVIPVNAIFTAKSLLFVFDASLFAAVQLTPLSTTDNICNCLSDVYGFNHENCPGKITGIVLDSISPVTVNEEGTNTFGLTAKIGFTCSLESFLCENRSVFARCLWYLEGHHALWHALNSPAFSRYNTVDKPQVTQLMADYLAMYMTELEMVISGINLNENDLCLECDPLFQRKFVSL